jgi:protein-L-isoaspartate O-methyltransferase
MASEFGEQRRPILRWVKGDGKDDAITHAAIAQATRLFGDRVDYCLTANSIDADRARRVLASSAQPVELWFQSPDDNAALADRLRAANCSPGRFGYWWKWFPGRLRSNAPEIVLDGDMVIAREPPWFERWRSGENSVWVTEDPLCTTYGQYQDLVDSRRLYSGLLAFPPGFDWNSRLLEVLAERPLRHGHDGTTDPSEQGCVAAALSGVKVEAIPLDELPFGRAFESHLDFGPRGRSREPWGYHFGRAFAMENRHFSDLVQARKVYSRDEPPSVVESCTWLRDFGQCGREGWSMHPQHAQRIDELAQKYSGREVLELCTSRGCLTAILATHGCRVTTVDQVDRGAARNLEGLGVRVVISDFHEYLSRAERDAFDLLVLEKHDIGPDVFENCSGDMVRCLRPGGQLALYNSHVGQIPEWREEIGLRSLFETQITGWNMEIIANPLPGVIIATKSRSTANSYRRPTRNSH